MYAAENFLIYEDGTTGNYWENGDNEERYHDGAEQDYLEPGAGVLSFFVPYVLQGDWRLILLLFSVFRIQTFCCVIIHINRPNVGDHTVEAADEEGDRENVIDVSPSLRLPTD